MTSDELKMYLNKITGVSGNEGDYTKDSWLSISRDTKIYQVNSDSILVRPDSTDSDVTLVIESKGYKDLRMTILAGTEEQVKLPDTDDISYKVGQDSFKFYPEYYVVTFEEGDDFDGEASEKFLSAIKEIKGYDSATTIRTDKTNIYAIGSSDDSGMRNDALFIRPEDMSQDIDIKITMKDGRTLEFTIEVEKNPALADLITDIDILNPVVDTELPEDADEISDEIINEDENVTDDSDTEDEAEDKDDTSDDINDTDSADDTVDKADDTADDNSGETGEDDSDDITDDDIEDDAEDTDAADKDEEAADEEESSENEADSEEAEESEPSETEQAVEAEVE